MYIPRQILIHLNTKKFSRYNLMYRSIIDKEGRCIESLQPLPRPDLHKLRFRLIKTY